MLIYNSHMQSQPGIGTMATKWQKGFLYGLAFGVAAVVVSIAALVFAEFKLESMHKLHVCFSIMHGFSETSLCSLRQAVISRISLFVPMLFVFSLPSAVFGGIIGYLMEKFRNSY